MSGPVKLFIGTFFLILGGLFFTFELSPETQQNALKLYVIRGAPFAIAAIFIIAGFVKKIDISHPYLIKEKFQPSNILLGFCISAGSVLILYLFYNVIHVSPIVLVVGALVGVPIGLILMFTLFGEACVKCDKFLEKETKKLEEIPLPKLGNRLSFNTNEDISFHYCPKCKNFLLAKNGTREVLLQSTESRLVIDAIKSAKA